MNQIILNIILTAIKYFAFFWQIGWLNCDYRKTNCDTGMIPVHRLDRVIRDILKVIFFLSLLLLFYLSRLQMYGNFSAGRRIIRNGDKLLEVQSVYSPVDHSRQPTHYKFSSFFQLVFSPDVSVVLLTCLLCQFVVGVDEVFVLLDYCCKREKERRLTSLEFQHISLPCISVIY